MDNAPGVRFVSLTFLVGFGLGAFIGVGLALLAVAIARPEDEEPQFIEIPIISTATPTPLPEDTPDPGIRATAALAVRVGPGNQFATLGTISRGDTLDVVGRDFDSEWLAIRFPAGSNAQGWVPAADVDGLTFPNLQALSVLLPTPLPVEFVTPPPFFGSTATPGTGTPEIEVGTPDPLAGTVDMAVADVRALTDGRIRVVVLNGGPADLANAILTVTVRTLGGSFETFRELGGLEAGETVSFTTSTLVVGDEPMDIQVVVDPSAGINDPDRSNNVVTTLLSRSSAVPPAPSGTSSGAAGSVANRESTRIMGS